jgi:hypothetical protein
MLIDDSDKSKGHVEAEVESRRCELIYALQKQYRSTVNTGSNRRGWTADRGVVKEQAFC